MIVNKIGEKLEVSRIKLKNGHSICVMLSRFFVSEHEIRQKQINTLKVFNDNVIEVQEGSEYSINFLSGGNELCLIVILSKDFPVEKPVLKISPIVLHDWVNSEGEITSAPGLLNFTIHSDLGRVVRAVIREFECTPPPLAFEHLKNNVSPTIPICKVPIKGNEKFSPTMHYTYNQSIAFPQLNTLSLEELQFLNECNEQQDEFLENLPQVKEMNKNIDDLLDRIEELTDENLAKQNILQDLEHDIEEKIEQVTKLAFENERLNVEYQALSDKYSPRNIKEQLRLAAQSADSQSDKIANSFLNGEMDVDKFLNAYISVRTLSQLRKTKEEKLANQLESLEKAGF